MSEQHPHVHTEISRTSWLERIKGAFAGIAIGLILALAGVVLLFWNEGRAVATSSSLDEGAAAVRSVVASRVDPANDGALVHLSAPAQTTEILRDDTFGLGMSALRMERRVEMFQWLETRESRSEKKLGGGTETVTEYRYSTGWSGQLHDSSAFRQPRGHANPSTMRFADLTLRSASRQAREVHLGAFQLSPQQVARIGGARAIVMDDARLKALAAPFAGTSVSRGGWLYLSTDRDTPEVGDLRVQWTIVPPTEISIVAMQRGEQLVPYPTDNDRHVELVHTGTALAEQMFERAQTENTVLTWVLRAAGALAIVMGLSLVLRPLSVLADVVPALGNLVAAGTGVVASTIGLAIALTTIALAWLAHRPMIALPLLLAAIALFVVPRMLGRRAKPRAPVPPPPTPPAARPGA